MKRYHKNWRNHNHLHGDGLDRMQSSHGKCSRLFVFVMHFVEIHIKERKMEDTMHPVSAIVLVEENNLKVFFCK